MTSILDGNAAATCGWFSAMVGLVTAPLVARAATAGRASGPTTMSFSAAAMR